MAADKPVEEAKQGTLAMAKAYGRSPLPPMILATFVTALHANPFQFLPMTVPTVLLFSTYLNLSEYKTDSAGITAAWSGLYLLLANRRQNVKFIKKFGTRGIIRGTAMGVAAFNVATCGYAYATGKSGREEE